jgi:Cu(I)/Ag(I) efflux system protein CusF
MFRIFLAATILTAALTVSAMAQEGRTEGEVRKIDTEQKKITLRHGPIIGALNMPAMTMPFKVKEDHLLHHVQVGDRVDAIVLQENNALYILSIERK